MGALDTTPPEIQHALTASEHSDIVRIPFAQLRVSDSPRIRGESTEHVRVLLESEIPFPPIIVHRSTMRIIDGMHRYWAAEARGDTEIAAVLFDGAESEAFVLAVRSNVHHGLPLSLSDRKAAAQRILVSFPHWSNRSIARVVGLSHKTVGGLRSPPTGENSQLDERLGDDGRTRPVDRNAGRQRAGELLHNTPDMPLSQVSNIAGISPTTALDVRERIRQGDDPTLPRKDTVEDVGDRYQTRAPRRSDSLQPTQHDSGDTTDLHTVLERLKSDPALRFNDFGRVLLRLFQLHMEVESGWDRLIETVPGYHAELVARAARQCSGTWQRVAERLIARS